MPVMYTDIGPIVQRLLQRLVLAGVPIMTVGCGGSATLGTDSGASGGKGGINGLATGGRGSGGVVGTATGGNSWGGVGSGGAPATGGSGAGGVGSGGAPVTGGSGAGGVGSGGALATGGIGAGGVGSGGAPATGGRGGGGATGGAPMADGGTDLGDAPQACHPLTTSCALHDTCQFPKTIPFDPDDPRWAGSYRACVASGGVESCGPECRGFCNDVLKTVVPRGAGLYIRCKVSCESPNTVTYSYFLPSCGRRPSGARTAHRRADSETPLGGLLATAAELEAASVPAFRRVAADLAAHGAPTNLVQAARSAVVDEARHWRRTRELARRRGGHPKRPLVPSALPASLDELAIDNVVEGCVRETFGAMVASYQAVHAADPDVRRLMADIAEDELKHAALSWQIDAWASAKLPPPFQARRNLAARAALRELVLTADGTMDESARQQAGLPSAEDVEQLMGAAWATVWSRAFGATRPDVQADATVG